MRPEMRLTALDSVLDPGARRDLLVPPRSNIADMVMAAFPGTPNALRRDIVVATVNGEVVPVEAWASVRPKLGTTVLLKPVPQGDLLRSALLVAVTVAAIAAGQFYGPLLANSLVFGAGSVGAGTLGSVATAAITATTLLAGTLLINALVPARKDEKDKPSYAISGLQNQLTPDGVVPLILGRVRYALPYATKPFTQSIGDDRFVTAAVCAYGPLSAKDWRIGQTPLERFPDVVFETRQGLPDDARLTLTPNQVLEEALSIELLSSAMPRGGPQIRTTASDATYCEVDNTFPGGVFSVNKDGETQAFTVDIATRFRPAGDPGGLWTPGPVISVTSTKRKSITRTTRIDFPTRGRYEIEQTRITPDWDEVDQSNKKIQRSGRSAWSVLRSFRPEYPIAFEKPLFLAACRIRATGQLNGVIDALNAEFCSICPDWDAASGTWIERETNNPASLFRYVLTGPAITYPLGSADIAALGDWHAFCAAKGLTYNRVHDYEGSVLDVLSDIAAAGRASPQNGGTTWGVVIDRALETVAAHIGPRNSWGFSGERPYVRFPDAFRVSFLDETNSYERAERIVPWPGFIGSPAVVEKLDLPGVTNPDMVWRETRRRQYELIQRRDTYTVNQDWESLVVQRGDRVQLGHDVIDRVMVSGRVVDVSGSRVTLDEAVTMEEGKAYAIRFRRSTGTSLLRTVRTIPGTRRTIRLDGVGEAPSSGNPSADPPIPPDLAFFGLATRETLACTVKGVEAMQDFTARLTLVDHASEIEALVDADVPPTWSGRAGGEAAEVTAAPFAPTIGEVTSGLAAAEYATAEISSPVLVPLAGNAMSPVPAVTFLVRHRLSGTTAWAAPVSVPVAAGLAVIPGYASGQQVQLQPAAVSAANLAGAWGAIVSHLVAGDDPAVPANLQVVIERRAVSGSTTAAALRLTCTSVASDKLQLTGGYRAVGAADWLDMAHDSENRFSVVSPTVSDGTEYEVEGAISTLAGARRSAYIDASPATIRATADASPPTAPTYATATLTGTTVNHEVRQSPSANASRLELVRALGFGKSVADGAVSATENLGPNVARTLTDEIDLGLYQWWLRALNASGVSSSVAGPRSVLRFRPPANLLVAPNDLTNAAWSRFRLTAATLTTAPDGGAASILSETADTGTHIVLQIVSGLTSGGRYRFVLAVRPVGRNRFTLSLGDSSLASYVAATVNLGTAALASEAVGSAVTDGEASLTRLSAEWWLVTVTATVAATSAQVRLNLRDDAGQSSYAGDSAKGLHVAAALTLRG